jgi:hypothetical protein
LGPIPNPQSPIPMFNMYLNRNHKRIILNIL